MLPHYQKQRNSDDQLPPGERVLQAVQAHIVDNSAAPNADWLQQLSHLYDKLAKQWGLQSFDVYHISTYGLVLETQSTIYGDVVLKMIPPYTARYPREKAAYQQLAGDYMCPLLATDDACCALLLRRIAPGKYADFDDNICLTDFFNRVVCTAKETVRHPVFPAYRVDLEAALQRSRTAPFLTGSLEQEVRSALALYDTQFKNSKTYLLHGDLHHYNLLRTAEGYRAIDPIGCLAPIEFEFTRFIRNDILQHPGFDPRERLQLLLRYFSRWAEPERIQAALQIDLSLTAVNATYESTEPAAAETQLALLQIAKAGTK